MVSEYGWKVHARAILLVFALMLIPTVLILLPTKTIGEIWAKIVRVEFDGTIKSAAPVAKVELANGRSGTIYLEAALNSIRPGTVICVFAWTRYGGAKVEMRVLPDSRCAGLPKDRL